mgnify:CR=1 FL=1
MQIRVGLGSALPFSACGYTGSRVHRGFSRWRERRAALTTSCCWAALGERREKSVPRKKSRRLTSSQSVDGTLNFKSGLGALGSDHDRVVTGNGAERAAQARFIERSGDAGGSAGERLDHDEIACHVYLFNQFETMRWRRISSGST